MDTNPVFKCLGDSFLGCCTGESLSIFILMPSLHFSIKKTNKVRKVKILISFYFIISVNIKTLHQKLESSAGRKKIPSIKFSVFVGAKKTGYVCRDKKTYC